MMESFEVHSKDFLVKWINVPDSSVVKWQVKPLKKSILFSIYRKIGSFSAGTHDEKKKKIPLEEKLSNSNLQLLQDMGKLSANELHQNEFVVKDGDGGVYAFVFDNTFSKSVSKKVLFAQFIEPMIQELVSESNSVLSIPAVCASPIIEESNHSFSAPAPRSLSQSSQPLSRRPSSNVNNPEAVKPRFMSGSGNRDRSASVYTLSNLLNDQSTGNDNEDFQILKQLQDLQNSSNAATSPTIPSFKATNGSSMDLNFEPPHGASKFRKKSSHSSLSHRRRSNSTTSVRTSKSNKNKNEASNINNSSTLEPFNINLLKNTVLTSKNGQYIEGNLLKRKRKKNSRSYSKRFFSLNFKQGVLEYRMNDQSSATRGSMHIKLVEITANRKNKEITIDSGLEIWHLKALNEVDWEIWVSSLDIIRLRANYNNNASDEAPKAIINNENTLIGNLTELRDKLQITKKSASIILGDLNENMQSMNGNASPKISSYSQPTSLGQLHHKNSSSSFNSTDSKESKSFFRRPSVNNGNLSHSLSSAINRSNSSINESVSEPVAAKKLQSSLKNTKDLCVKLSEMSDLLTRILETVKLSEEPIAEKKLNKRSSLGSIDESILSENFFDAHDYIESIESNDGVILIEGTDDDFDDAKEDDGAAIRMSNSQKYRDNVIGELINQKRVSAKINAEQLSIDETDAATITTTIQRKKNEANDDLYPLDILQTEPPVPRRKTIEDSSCTPPSLLQFFKKNVGKDMSSIAMPVTANEPLTILQKFAEIFEYTHLIDKVVEYDMAEGEKILHISAFAISYLSSFRSKERNIRKPFMPLLGETYELVRDDLNYRLILEKVCHKPPIFCLHIDNANWEISSTIMPVNKFWGKSLELINKGSFKLTFKASGEVYEWNQPTTLLRNLIAGEKYIEPVDSITINCSTGEKSVVEFKPGGMFTGRSEEVTIKAYDANDKLRNVIIKGSWKEKLFLAPFASINSKKKAGEADNETEIWAASPLLPNSQKKWGFTNFAAQLNEITVLEEKKLPPTDSRLRPDLQKYENSDVDTAETLKVELEQQQRERRKEMETSGEKHVPKFFAKDITDSNDDDILLNWNFVTGEKSYWNRRKTQDWEDLLQLYETQW
ncbi:oxysterol-binding protein related protein [Saccharomycopsis crataegensis]|uniref:Oxysterol-binding protein related protein n=1 Tax=Saccharomycopsis crataegensis TaxID=43959 RepID=A0AAV5QSK0_9ASCO|nr:oxysterol-binding protein related protein [Saccharomycopsis crataegensis]